MDTCFFTTSVFIFGKKNEDIENILYEQAREKENDMRLRNVLIVVKDIEKSKKFYHDLFGLDMILDNDGNMILTEGLVLQDEKIWKQFLGREIVSESNACELYFEEKDMEGFIKKLEELYPDIRYVNRLMTHSWGQQVVRFYDLDGNLIEVGTPL
ncbi:Catechol 2,3-dioxygenase [Lachnospiraceae bacterium XBB1006]|nr:Catechol 2,3-dioxygenase [Lachnospiraceae bacterium XBB1006]